MYSTMRLRGLLGTVQKYYYKSNLEHIGIINYIVLDILPSSLVLNSVLFEKSPAPNVLTA